MAKRLVPDDLWTFVAPLLLRDTSVVIGFPGDYGSGVQRVPGSPATVAPTGQDGNALVVLERQPSGELRPVTQCPTNKSVTP